MLNDLKFCAGAVAKKDFVPSLLHFRIANGHIYGFNGQLAISTPTDLQVTCVPKAASLIKAMEKVDDNVELVLNLTQTGKLSVKSGRFRVYIECIEDNDIAQIEPSGVMIPLPVGLLHTLNILQPFISVDASRPWSRGILLRGQSAFATNNIVLLEHWLPYVFPSNINIPAEAVKEIIRIGIEPSHVQLDDRSVTFHYPNGAWIRTGLGVTEWPDLAKVLERSCNPKPIPHGYFDALRRLDAFADKSNQFFMRGGTIATHNIEGEGACVDLDDFGGIGSYLIKQMAHLDGVAVWIDFSLYPGPCIFYGNMIRGAIIGQRMSDPI